MKARVNTPVKPCPFCGGEIHISRGFINATFWFFKCYKCGAVISFNNDECNTTPSKALEYYERRAQNE